MSKLNNNEAIVYYFDQTLHGGEWFTARPVYITVAKQWSLCSDFPMLLD